MHASMNLIMSFYVTDMIREETLHIYVQINFIHYQLFYP